MLTSTDRSISKSLHTEEVIFKNGIGIGNYPSNGLFHAVEHDMGDPWKAFAQDRRFALFDVVTSIRNECLQVMFVSNARIHHQNEIIDWISLYQHCLNQLVAVLPTLPCRWTLADFPLLFKSYSDLETFQVDILPALGISRSEVEDVFPCGSTQKGILISQAKDDRLHRVRFEIEVRPDTVDPARLKDAWYQVVQRHGILRMILVQNMPRAGFAQILLKRAAPDMQMTFPGCADQGKSSRQRNPGSPDHSIEITREHNGCLLLALNINHALIDAHSYDIILRDLQLAYKGLLNSVPMKGFKDYVSYVEAQQLEGAQEFWKKQLQGIEICRFPAIDGCPSDRFTRHVMTPAVDHDQLRQFCRDHEVTVSSICQVAWALVLQAYVGSSAPCFGYVSSGREHPIPGVNDIVGPLIVTLPCLITLPEDATVLDVVYRAQHAHVESLAHHLLPLHDILHMLALQTKPFNTGISVTSGFAECSAVARDPEISLVTRGGQDPTEFDIAVQVAATSESIKLSLTYAASLMSESMAASVASSLSTAIMRIASSPKTSVRDINIAGEKDLAQLWRWNQVLPPASPACLHDLINAQVMRNPGVTAVDAWDGTLSYGELDRLSNDLASRLIQAGVQTEVLVPFCFEKSMWTVVAMLATLKAGGAFVPLSPGDPGTRHQSILTQTNAHVVLASSNSAEFPVFSSCEVITVNAQSVHQASLPEMMTGRPAMTTAAAYVLFTSGSTGEPKGVVVSHAAISTSCLEHGKAMGFGEGSRVLQFSAHVFDASIQEIFTTLVYGGCVCIPSDEDRVSRLGPTIRDLGVTWACLTPSVSATLAPRYLCCLKTLILCGERVTASALQDWSVVDNIMVGYGPTECSVVCVAGSARPEVLALRSEIGTPLGSRAMVVDPTNHNKPLPIGAVGELVIQGAILARGYLNDPVKTATSFISDPAWLLYDTSNTSKRIYKTGDLVRYNHNGVLEFVGRRDDQQTKVNGQRVELGEIEQHLRGCLQIACKSVVTTAVLPSQHTPSIVAFIQLQGRQTDKHTENCSLLLEKADVDAASAVAANAKGQKMPTHLCPKLFIPINQIPLTSSGKTDRRRLQKLVGDLSAEQVRYLLRTMMDHEHVHSPRTLTEHGLRALYARALEMSPEHISVSDNFFQLGGDSLSAIKLAPHAREEGFDISVSELFLRPKLSDLAEHIDNPGNTLVVRGDAHMHPLAFSLIPSTLSIDAARALAATSCNVNTDQVSNIYPCTELQSGMMALSIKHLGEYMVCYVLELDMHVDERRWRQAWEAAFCTLPILRTRIAALGDIGVFQVVVDQNLVWDEFDGPPETYVTIKKNTPMALGEPLTRLAMSKQRHFVLTMHHSVFDGWSLSLIFEHVSWYYHARSPATPPLNLGHDVFMEYLSRLSDAESVEFWRSHLDGAECSHFPAPASKQLDQRELIEDHCTLDSKLTSSTTLATLVKVAWALVVAGHTASQDIVFGCTVSGRNAQVHGIDRIMGPTVATIPVRVRLAHIDQPIAELISAVQETSATSIRHEQMGLAKIAACSTDADTACDFQTLVLLQPDDNGCLQMSSFGKWISDHAGASIRAYPLVLQVQLLQKGFSVTASFNPSSIGRDEMNCLLRQLVYVVPRLVSAGPTLTVGQVNVATPLDLAQIRSWNSQPLPRIERCVHDLIAMQASSQPSAVAVCSWDGSLSYQDLHAMSDDVARRLCALGNFQQAIIPLFFEKCKWTAIAVLAVMKVGAACLNVDVSSPSGRLQATIDQVKPPAILCSAATEHLVPVLASGLVIKVDELLATRSCDVDADTPLPAVSPSGSLYVVFTSGSTGKPKGISITHANFSSAAWYQQKELQFSSGCRVFDYVSYAFDVAWSNMLHTWIAGGCLCVPSFHERWNNVAGAIDRMSVNYAHLTPSIARTIDPAAVPTLRILNLIGEPLTASDVARWASTSVNLINTYGPAECTVTSTLQHVDKNATCVDPPIGSGVGLHTWIAEPTHCRHLVPIGSVGELVLSGPLVGAGYISEPAKTAAAFIEAPEWFADAGHDKRGDARLYRTGDLVKYSSALDGSLTFVGRSDGQVKVRGQRVELGEVEHHVATAAQKCLALDGLSVAADLVTPKDNAGRPILVAFVAIRHGSATFTPLMPEERDRMTEQLLDKVPSYMVPGAYVLVDKIPLTATGKTNKRRLREVGCAMTIHELTGHPQRSESKAESSTTEETQLRAIWARLLNRQDAEIGARSNFFELGGDSITAMRVVAACCHEPGLNRIRMEDIFKQKTIASLARLAKQRGDDDSLSPALQQAKSSDPLDFPLAFDDYFSLQTFIRNTLPRLGLTLSQVEDVYPCTPTQEGILLQQARFPKMYYPRFEFDICVSETGPPVDVGRLQWAWHKIVARHPILRTVFVDNLPGRAGFAQLVLRMSDQTAFCITQDEKPPHQDICLEPFEKDGGPVISRTHRVDIQQGKQARFTLTINHACIDAHSVQLLLGELTEFYSSDHAKRNSAPFKDFVSFSLSQSRSITQHYWTERLASVEPCIFPARHLTARQDIEMFTVRASSIDAEDLKAFCGKFHVTTSSICQVAWALVLRAFTRSQQPCFGFVSSGRDQTVAQIESIVGPLIVILPFSIALAGSSTMSELVQGTQDQMLDALRY
jgi:amino acid adenylation domain-containing protein